MILPPSPLYDWIQSHGVPLSQIQDLHQELISGRILQQILDLPSSSDIWHRIAVELAPLGIVVTDACIKAIRAGDASLVGDILSELYNRSTTTDELISLLQVSLHRCLHIDQAYALQLLDHRVNIQLSEYLRQGRPGVVDWLSAIIQATDGICAAIGSQPLNLIYILRLLSPALHCQTNSQVCQLTSRIIALIAMKVIPTSSSMVECAWQWVSGNSAGLVIIIDAWRFHPSLSFILLPMLECLVGHRISDIIRFMLPKALQNEAERYGFIQELFAASCSNHQSSYLTESLILHVFHEVISKISNSSAPEAAVVAGLNLVTQIMTNFYEELRHIDPEYPNSILALLRQGCRGQAHTDIQMASIANLSESLDICLEKDPACDQPFSMRVFKSLIFVMMERYDDQFIRHFVSHNLCLIIQRSPSLPVDILGAPLMKQIPLQSITNEDLDLLIALSRHEQLSIRTGTVLLHILAKICLQIPSQIARLASIPFCIVLCRFQSHPAILQYVLKLSLMALRTVIENDHVTENQDSSAKDSVATLALELIAKIIHLPYPTLKAQVHPLIVTAINQFRKAHGYGHVGLEALDDYLTNESEFALTDLLGVDSGELASSNDEIDHSVTKPNHSDANQTENVVVLPSKEDEVKQNEVKQSSKPVVSDDAQLKSRAKAKSRSDPEKGIVKTGRNQREVKEAATAVSERRTAIKSPTQAIKPENNTVRSIAPTSRLASSKKPPAQNATGTAKAESVLRASIVQEKAAAQLKSNPIIKDIVPVHRKMSGKLISTESSFQHVKKEEISPSESDQIEEVTLLLKRNDRRLRDVFREYKGQRPLIAKFNTFDLQSKADACMSIPDFIKFWEDISICPAYISKSAISGIFRSCCSGELSSMLINYNEFVQSVNKVGKHISQEIDNLETNANILARTAFIINMIKDARESTAKRKTQDQNSSQSTPKIIPASLSRSDVKAKEEHVVEEVVTVMMELMSAASWERMDREQLKSMLKPARKSEHVNAVVPATGKSAQDADEKERKRQQRRKELAKQLVVRRQEAIAKEAARKAEIEESKKLEAESRETKRKAAEQERILIRKKLEQYQKRKQEEEQKKKEIEEARKQLELEERKKSIALFQKQKREREQLEQQLQAQKMAIEQNANEVRAPTRLQKDRAKSPVKPTREASIKEMDHEKLDNVELKANTEQLGIKEIPGVPQSETEEKLINPTDANTDKV